MAEERKTPSLKGNRVCSATRAGRVSWCSAIFVAVRLPAEFHRDPDGFWKSHGGLEKVAGGPRSWTVRRGAAVRTRDDAFLWAGAFATTFIEITMRPGDDKGEAEITR